MFLSQFFNTRTTVVSNSSPKYFQTRTQTVKPRTVMYSMNVTKRKKRNYLWNLLWEIYSRQSSHKYIRILWLLPIHGGSYPRWWVSVSRDCSLIAFYNEQPQMSTIPYKPPTPKKTQRKLFFYVSQICEEDGSQERYHELVI